LGQMYCDYTRFPRQAGPKKPMTFLATLTSNPRQEAS